MTTDSLFRIPYDQLSAAVATALRAHGVPEALAATEATIMAEADLHGTPSHGVKMLPALLRALDSGLASADPQIRTVTDFGAICVLDGDNGIGRHVALTAMQTAVQRAKQFGVGVCVAKRTTHWGRAHAYALRAAQAGCIGFCTTNAVRSMAAWGATKPVIGNNPIAIGVPRGEAEPLVLDIAMSQAAVGKVTTWLREGRPLPAGWGVDAQGRPSNDPQAILSGAVSPMGGHKGSGLALMMEMMTAALGGGDFCDDIVVPPGGIETNASKIFIALNVEAFGAGNDFAPRIDAFIDYLRAEASDNEPFLYPGERGWQDCARNLRDGVPLHEEIVQLLEQAGVALGR